MGDNFLNCSIGLLIPFVGTSLGAACVFFMKNNILVWCFSIVAIFYTSTTLAAPKGICTPDNCGSYGCSINMEPVNSGNGADTITGNGKNVILSGIYRILDWNIISFVS